jgi:hypothetical protein
MEASMQDDTSRPHWYSTPRPITREAFETLLLEARNGAHIALTRLAAEDSERAPHDAKIEDARAVWHAAEVALGLLTPGYVPKRESLNDATRMLARLADDYQSWPETY